MANQPTKYKKFLAGAASATLVATAIVPTALAAEVENAATDFSDVAATHTHYAAIMQAVERELFNGYGDGTFKPENSIERKGVTKALANYVVAQSDYKTYEEYITANKLVETVTPFTDVPATHGDSELFNASLIVKDSGIFSGSNNNLMPNKNISRQQMAKVLVNGFGLKDLAGVESEVTDTDKAQAEYVNFINILSENDVTEVTTYNPTGDVKRGQMASFLNRAFDAAHKVVAPETATKVVSVSATNLVQAVIAFDGSVDEATATDVENYEIDGKVIKSAALSADGKSVILTLDTTGSNTPFVNQTEYKLTFSNVKAGAKEISEKEYKFTPIDATLPTVTSVTALGNKTLSVKFSEPIKTANTSNFTIDGKTVVGETKVSGNTVIVKLYSTLDNGEHTVAIKDVVDFNNFKSLNVEEKFSVVEDVTAPAISSVVKASFEKVTIKFSEQVDPSTVTASSAYWLQGSSKKYAQGVTQVSDDTFEFDFSNNKIQYTTDLYITGVKDYSSNTIAADSKIQVNPVIDQTRPEVSSLVYDAALKSFTVKFNKTVDEASAEKAANYVIKNSDGDIVSKFKTATLNLTNNKEVTVQLVDALTAGKTYTVDVAGVSDNTTLKNVMMPFTKSITVADIANPTVNSVVRNTDNNTLLVNFNKKMAVSGDGSIVDKSKYFYSTNAVGTPTTWKTLPNGSSVNVSSDGKSAIVQLPSSEILVLNIQQLRVQLVKDEKNNYLADLTQDKAVTNRAAVTYDAAVATDNNKVEVEFSRALLANTVNANDFTVKSGTTTLNVLSASLNSTGTKVVLTLADTTLLNDNATYTYGTTSPAAVTVDVSATATTSTVDGTKVGSGSRTVADNISAEVVSLSGVTGNGIAVTFGETLETVSASGNEETDFIITDENGDKLVPTTDYTVTTTGNVASIDFTVASGLQGVNAVYTVSLNPRFLTDANLNLVGAVTASDAIDVYVADSTAAVAPTLTTATNQTGTTNAITAVPAGETAWLAPAGTTTFAAGATMTTAVAGATTIASPTTEGAYKLFLVDAAGNVSPASTGTVTVDNTVAAAVTPVAQAGLLTITGAAGTAEAGAEIKVYAASTGGVAIPSTTTVTVATDGSYTWTASAALTASTVYYVEVTDVAGNVSTRTAVTTPAI